MYPRVDRDAQQGVRTALPHGRVALAPHIVPVPGRSSVDERPQKRESTRAQVWGCGRRLPGAGGYY